MSEQRPRKPAEGARDAQAKPAARSLPPSGEGVLDPAKIRDVRYVLSAASAKQFPPEDRPEVAFAGRSNVGKSSLLNTLVRRKNLARTSNTPGKTRLLNFYELDEAMRFVDLPGYGFARVGQAEKRQWAELIEGYLKNRRSLAVLVHLLDARHEPTREDRQMWEWAQDRGIPVIWALTKIDKLPKNKARSCSKEFARWIGLGSDAALVPFSSVTRQGVDELWARILDLAGHVHLDG